MNYFCLPPEEVIGLNRGLIANDFNVLDRGKLEDALAAPVQTFGGQYLIPSVTVRAAELLVALVKAHAFADGNKRTAWVCAVSYLNLEGFDLGEIDAEEVACFVEGVALDVHDRDSAAAWFSDRLR